MTRRFQGATHYFVCGVLTCILSGAVAQVSAQQPQAPPAPVAPVMQFPAQGITLEEAVQLTLQHEPGIQRAEADARFRGGVALQQAGLFDVTFSGSFDYSQRFQELTQSAKDEQQKKRDELQGLIDAGPAQIALAQEGRDLIAGIQNGTVAPEDLTTVSPTLAATLVTLDELIRTSSPDLAQQFQSTKDQVLSDALRIADAELDAQKRIFTSAQDELRNIGPAPVDDYFKDAALSMQVSKVFRNGIAIAPFFDGSYSSNGFRGKPHQVRFGGKGLTDLFEFRAGFNVLLPLARGRGADATAAPERAAGIEHDGSLLALEHQRATSVLSTVRAYWALRAAQESATIATESLAFQQQLVTLIQALVNAGDLAGIELSRAQAAEARARADVDDTERRLRDARIALLVTMGIGADSTDASLPRARDAFPQSATPPAQPTTLVDQALDQRQDLGAAAKYQEAGQVLATGARLDLRPILDLNLGTWVTALDEGTVGKALDRWVGPSASVGVAFEKPFGNNSARGQLEQREADATLRTIDQADLARLIQLRVLQTSGTLQQSVTQVEQARAAVDFYQQTVEAELARLRAGDATVLDTIVTQQQQIGARLGLVSAQLELARRLAELRYETGTLVTGGTFRAQDLVTVPGGGRQ